MPSKEVSTTDKTSMSVTDPSKHYVNINKSKLTINWSEEVIDFVWENFKNEELSYYQMLDE